MNNTDGRGHRHYSDTCFEWRMKNIYIPAWNFSGLDYETTTATDIKSIGVGSGNDMALSEINTSNVTGITLGANDDTVEHLMAIPMDLDRKRNVYFRVYWTANNTSGSVTWDVLYKAYVPGTTTVGNAAATTALSAAIGAHSMAGTAFTLMRTPNGVLLGDTLTDDVTVMQLSVKRTAVSTVTAAIFMGLEILYTPRLLRGPDGMRHDGYLA